MSALVLSGIHQDWTYSTDDGRLISERVGVHLNEGTGREATTLVVAFSRGSRHSGVEVSRLPCFEVVEDAGDAIALAREACARQGVVLPC